MSVHHFSTTPPLPLHPETPKENPKSKWRANMAYKLPADVQRAMEMAVGQWCAQQIEWGLQELKPEYREIFKAWIREHPGIWAGYRTIPRHSGKVNVSKEYELKELAKERGLSETVRAQEIDMRRKLHVLAGQRSAAKRKPKKPAVGKWK